MYYLKHHNTFYKGMMAKIMVNVTSKEQEAKTFNDLFDACLEKGLYPALKNFEVVKKEGVS